MEFDRELLPYLEVFLEETEEQLQSLEERLVYLEKHPGDRGCLEEIFRLAHTLKGNAATVGFEGMTELAHRMEDLLDCLRRGRAAVTPQVTDALLAALDALKGLAQEAAGKGGCTADLKSLTSRLESLASEPQAAEPKRKTEGQAVRVRVSLAEDCSMRAARAYVVLRCLEEFGTLVEASPTLSEVENLGFEGNTIEARLVVSHSSEVLAEALWATPEVKEVQVVPLESPVELYVEVGESLDPKALVRFLSNDNSSRLLLDLRKLRDLSPAGLDWLFSVQEEKKVSFRWPDSSVGRKLFGFLGLS
jgi:two-component system chemotaxis sensor kinase CheA